MSRYLVAAFYTVPQVTQSIIYIKMIQCESGSLPIILGEIAEIELHDINLTV